MHERCPYVCHVKVTYTLLPTNSFVFTQTNSIKCLVNWIPLRIRIRLKNTQPNLEYVFDLHLFTIFTFFVGLPNTVSLRLQYFAWEKAIQRPRTRSAAACHATNAHDRYLVANENV